MGRVGIISSRPNTKLNLDGPQIDSYTTTIDYDDSPETGSPLDEFRTFAQIERGVEGRPDHIVLIRWHDAKSAGISHSVIGVEDMDQAAAVDKRLYDVAMGHLKRCDKIDDQTRYAKTADRAQSPTP